MLSTTETAKIPVGNGLLNPSERPRAVAHTASSTPERTSTNHDIAELLGAVLSHTGYGTARPEACSALWSMVANAGRPTKSGQGVGLVGRARRQVVQRRDL